MDYTTIIVDDDPTALFLHQIIVKRSGLANNPLCFPGAKKTLDYLRDNRIAGRPYLILLDINMPGGTGWELLDAINQGFLYDRIYVLMVTSSVDRPDRERAKNYKQVIGFLEKPIDVNALVKIQESDIFKATMDRSLK